MGKDPAFLFYSKDWLTDDTLEMNARERGVYINLLAYQHINGSIPSNSDLIKKIAMCGEDENFDMIWENISYKFKPNGNRMVNQRLVKTVAERSKKAAKNRIIGVFAMLIRQSNLTQKQKESIKSEFNVNDFIDEDEGNITKRLTEWFNEKELTWLPSTVNHPGDGDGDGDKDVSVDVNEAKVKERDEELIKISKEFHELKNKQYPELLKKIDDRLINNGADELDKLIRIDGYTKEHIEEVLKFAVNDKFWGTRLISLSSIRKKGDNDLIKFVNILSRMTKNKKIVTTSKYDHIVEKF